MLRAVLDTNVVLSGLRSPTGASFELLRRLRLGHGRIVLSNTTLTEYDEVLKREAAALPLSLREIDQFLDFLSRIAEPFSPSEKWLPILPDVDDESFAQLAAESKTDALATFNVRHFVPACRAGIPVMTPSQFLAMLPP